MTNLNSNIAKKSDENILITGAAGFIGSHVADYFCKKNMKIFCLVKRSSNLQFIKHLHQNYIYGDITDLEQLEKNFENIDYVIHLAAYVKDWGDYKNFYDINVTGTLNVLKACKTNNIKNIILTGSISSYGEENSFEIKNEKYPYNSHYKYFLDKLFPCKMNFYRDSKADCTKEAIKYAEKNDLNLTIIEPCWVYGEREFNTGFYSYLKTVKNRIPFFPGSKKNNFHVIYSADLARAYFLAFKKKLHGVNRIIIGNEKIEKMDHIYSIFCNETGVPKPHNIPKFLIYPLGFIVELFYSIFVIKKPPLLTRGRVNMFYDNIQYSTENAKKILSFTSEYSLQAGIKKTVKWYKEQNLI